MPCKQVYGRLGCLTFVAISLSGVRIYALSGLHTARSDETYVKRPDESTMTTSSRPSYTRSGNSIIGTSHVSNAHSHGDSHLGAHGPLRVMGFIRYTQYLLF